VQRADRKRWALVTGCLEPGEQPAAGAVREVVEETGVLARAERIVSVSALPLAVCANGDQVHWLDIAFRCHAISGRAGVNDDESIDVRWFPLNGLPDLPQRLPRHVVVRPCAAGGGAGCVGRTLQCANQPILIAGDLLPVRLSRSRGVKGSQ